MPDAQQSTRSLTPAGVDAELAKLNEENYRDLLSTITIDPLLVGFFSGAGISVQWPGRMPAARDFQFGFIEGLAAVSNRFGVRLHALRAGETAARLDTDTVPLESLLQFLKDARGNEALDTCDVYRSGEIGATPNTAHRFLGEWIRRNLGPSLTVNIDHLIEDAVSVLGGQTDRRSSEDAYVYADVRGFTGDPSPGRLYKLHGSVLDRATLRMTLDRVPPSLPLASAEFFRRFLRLSVVCFMGWAGADLDLRPLILSEAAGGRIGKLYFLLHAREGDDQKELRRRNKKAFELIDATGARPLFGSAGALAQRLGKDLFGWAQPSDSERPPGELPSVIEVVADQMKAIITRWAEDERELDAVAGRVAGHLYMHLGMHREAYDTWGEVLELHLNDGVSRAALLRNMAHAQFRLHDIRATLRVNTQALEVSDANHDRLGRAWALFGLGSVCAAWPLANLEGFLRAGSRLQAATLEFHSLREREGDNPSTTWKEATRGEGAATYWLARWRQRWLGALLPRSTPLRDSLSKLYERSALLLEHEQINDVNELVNPLRSLALILAHGSPEDRRRALELAGRAEDLVRWTNDRQRASTVLRDVAAVHQLTQPPERLPIALSYWVEALEIAAGPPHGEPPAPRLARPTPLEVLQIVTRIESEMGSSVEPADSNGLGQALFGIAATVADMGKPYRGVAQQIGYCGVRLVERLPLPVWSKRLQILKLRLFLLRLVGR